MGYRYYYTMETTDITLDDTNKISSILEEESGYDCDVNYNDEEHSALFQLHDVSWDDPSYALQRISEQVPDKVFQMYYEGDSWDDRGSIYAKNGKTQTCEMIATYPEPSEFFKQ